MQTAQRSISHNGATYLLREAVEADVSEIRKVVNEAYKELSDQGWNYTATYQDEAVTWERMQTGRTFALIQDSKIIATILFSKKNYITQINSAYVGQFAVLNHAKNRGLGNLLMAFCEKLANDEKFDAIQLDTAQQAKRLVDWYLKRGYKIIGETHWEGKTYDSYIFEKRF
jgi:ribosomal protein S18 acetylase RimI-like enzyme